MTIREIFEDLMGLVGFDAVDHVTDVIRARILSDIRSALQLIQQAGEDYYAREDLAVSLLSGTASYQLAKSVQTVLEPARLSDGQRLIQLTSRAQYDDFGPLFLGQTGRSLSQDKPLAYFAETYGDPADADSVKITLRVVPTPNDNYSLTLPVINEPPVYDDDDIDDPSPTPPVPHKYHESILLPIARYQLRTCSLFARYAEKIPLIEADYDKALELLGLSNPRRKTSERKSELSPAGRG